MSKIDFRHHYVLVLDAETANTTFDEDGRMDSKSVLMYDCGWSVVDTRGGIYKEQSFVNRDIFVNERELMNSAYYSKKIPSMSQTCGAVNGKWQIPMKFDKLCLPTWQNTTSPKL